MSKGDWHKIDWTEEMISFMKASYTTMSNKEIASALGLKLQTLRDKMYEQGLYRMRLEYWTEDQVDFLKNNYQEMGDVEIAEVLQFVTPKEKAWTIKHVEKKRKYLKLNRTAEELAAIKQRNVDNGCFLLCPVKRWLATGVAKEGEIRLWRENNGRLIPRIKINGEWLFWSRWAWEKNYGPIPEGMNVVFKDDNPNNVDPANLELLTDGELSRKNSLKSSQGLSDNYVIFTLTYKKPELRESIKAQPELIEFQRQLLHLKRTILRKKDAV